VLHASHILLLATPRAPSDSWSDASISLVPDLRECLIVSWQLVTESCHRCRPIAVASRSHTAGCHVLVRPQAAKSGGMQPLSEGDAAPLVIMQLALGLLPQLHTANSYFKLRHALLQQEGGAFPGIALSSSIRTPNSHTCWPFPPRALSSSWSWSESPPSREGQRSRIASLVCGLTHLLVSFS